MFKLELAAGGYIWINYEFVVSVTPYYSNEPYCGSVVYMVGEKKSITKWEPDVVIEKMRKAAREWNF